MKINKLTPIAMMLGFTLFSTPSFAQSLEQSVVQTLNNNPNIHSAYNQYMSDYEGIAAAKGAYLPSLDLSGRAGYANYQDTTNSTGDHHPREIMVSLRQLIWDGSRTLNNIKRNTAETQAQRYQLLTTAQDTALSTAQMYLNVLQAEAVLKLSKANYDEHVKMYSNIQKRTEAGIGSTADLDQMQGRLARSHANWIASQSNLNDKITEFVKVVGALPKSLVIPEVDTNYVPDSLTQALQQAVKNNPVMKTAAYDIKAANRQYDQAQGKFYPNFSFVTSKQYGQDLNGVQGRTNEFKAEVQMNYNLYNGGTDTANARQAAYQINKAKDIQDRAYNTLTEGTRLAWSALELTNQQIPFLEQHVDASAKTVIAYEKQFQIGQRTLVDVLNSENELFQARKAYLQAYYNGILAKYRLLNATGLILNEMRIDVPKQWSSLAK